MSKKSFAELKAKFKQQQQEKEQKAGNKFQNNDIYPFWTMNAGDECIVRILPDANSENPAPFPISVELLEHQLLVDGKNRKIPSLENWGEADPIAELSQKYYKMGDADKGKMYWRSKINLLRALIIKDPLPVDPETGENAEGKVKTLRFGFQMMETLLDGIASDEIDIEPWDLKNGFNFRIKKTVQGKDKKGKEQYTYAIGSGFVRNSSDISDMNVELVDLQTLLPANPGLEKVQRLLDAHISGTNYEEDDDNQDNGDEEEKTSTTSKPSDDDNPPDDAPDTDPSDDATEKDEDEDDDEDEIIRRILEKRNASK